MLNNGLLILGLIFLGMYHVIGVKEYECPNYLHGIQALGATIILASIINMDYQILKFKIFVFIGNISYSFYLIHFIILLGLRPLGLSPILYFVVATFFSVILGSMLYKYIETPCKVIKYNL